VVEMLPISISRKCEGWLVMRPPFSWLCHQKPLPWRGDQLLVVSYRYMPMDLIGWLMMRRFLFLSRGSLDEASQGFILLDFIFFQLLLPSGPLAPCSLKVRNNPYIFGQLNAQTSVIGWMRRKKMKSGKYGGNV
jgi:hypothetical protein